jgi:O-antigen/teichoic acid export membrane protein
MVLARLLTPSDFGLSAMAAVLSGFVGSLRDFGLPLAVVREDAIDHDRLSRVLWINAKLVGWIGETVLQAFVWVDRRESGLRSRSARWK